MSPSGFVNQQTTAQCKVYSVVCDITFRDYRYVFLGKDNEIVIDNISRHVNMIQTFSHSSLVNFRKSTRKRFCSKIWRLRIEQEIQLKP